MKKINTSPISGMQEFLPDTQATFDKIKAKIAEVYRLHGFLHIETPTIDRNEVLFAKAGGDTETQIYRVIKTDEAAEDSTQSLRFDHTVPLARYVVEHESALKFPFRVTQIGRNFRGERAQKGRFREFYQCDVDIIGRGELPLAYDAQVIATFYDALRTFVRTPVKIRLNNRKFLSGVFEELGISDLSAEILNIIDHAEKVPAEKTETALREIGLSDENVVKITTIIDTHGGVEAVKALGFANSGLDELAETFSNLQALGLGDAVEIDLKIVRGLNYYTGTVFEAILPEYPELGSIGGGGRYDNLASNYTDQKFPGVGASIGLSRLFYVLSENGLIDAGDAAEAPVDVAVMPMNSNLYDATYRLAEKLRAENKSVDVVLTEKKLGDMMKYAASVAKAGIVLGDAEIEAGVAQIKDFASGKEAELKL